MSYTASDGRPIKNNPVAPPRADGKHDLLAIPDFLDRTKKPAGFTAEPPPAPEPEIIPPPQPETRAIREYDDAPDFTAAQRKLVYDLSMWGFEIKQICEHILDPRTGKPIAVRTLSRCFHDELELGALEGDKKIGMTSFEVAVGRPAEFATDDNGKILVDALGSPVCYRKEVPPNPRMLMFLAEVRKGIGWQKIVKIDTSAGGVTPELQEKLAHLDENDLLALKAIFAKKVGDTRRDARAARLGGPGASAPADNESPV